MPKIPIYETQAQPAESTRPFLKDPASEGMVGQAIERGVAQVSARLDEYRKERDILSASEALSRFADDERQYHKGEFELQGEQAQGSQTRGNEFYLQATEKHGKDLTGNAKKIFSQKALQYREYGLDKLATHEAQQHQVWKQSSFDKMKTLAEQDIKTGATKEKVLQHIDDLKSHLRELHKGVDTTEMEDKLSQTLLTQFLVEQAGINPGDMDGLLTEFSNQLDEKTKAAIKDFADKNEIDQSVAMYSQVLKAENGNNYQAMLSKIQSLPIGMKAKDALEQRVKADFATYKAMRDDQRNEMERVEAFNIVSMWGKGDYAGMYNAAMNAKWLDPSRREHFVVQSKAMIDAQITGNKSQFEQTNHQLEAYVSQAIESHPHLIEESDVLGLAGYGLSNEDANKYAKTLQVNKAKPNPRLAMVAEQMKKDEKNGQFGKKEADAQLRMNEALDGMRAFAKQFPDKDPYNDFYIPYRKELHQGMIREAYANVSKKIGAATVSYTPIAPEKRDDYATRAPRSLTTKQQFYKAWLGRDLTVLPPLQDNVIKPPPPPDPNAREGKAWYQWFTDLFTSSDVRPEEGSENSSTDQDGDVDLDFNIR